MKFLVVGLGSMGKRRIRNLLALGENTLAGFDISEHRIKEASDKYGIQSFFSFEEALYEFKPTALIISTSPESHMFYANKALEYGIDAFIEASVVDSEAILKLYEATEFGSSIILPSCTMMYMPGPIKVRELIEEKAIGKILNINYHTGQYLPDWHPWEDINSYYVSKRNTGGAREIVPFELTWLNAIFGEPEIVFCLKTKISTINADIDDIYHSILRYPDGILLNLTVEVLSRPNATRELRVIGSKGVIHFSGEKNLVRFVNEDNTNWVDFWLNQGIPEPGYINGELPYVDEIRDFISALKYRDISKFPNTLAKDHAVLLNLISLEKKAEF
jgi:predicted dehydrogenase